MSGLDIDPVPLVMPVPTIVGPGHQGAFAVGTPHFSFPFRRDVHGRTCVVEQDSDDEVLDCVLVLLSTEEGSRQEVPDYGLPDQTFRQGGVDLALVSNVLQRWEPRAEHVVTREQELIDMVDRVRISVAGRDSG